MSLNKNITDGLKFIYEQYPLTTVTTLMNSYDKDKDGIIEKDEKNNELDNFFNSNIEFQDAVLSIFDKDKNEALSKDELKNILNFINRNKGRILKRPKLSKQPPLPPSPRQGSRSPRPGSSRSRPTTSERGGKSHKSPLEKAIKKMIKNIFRPN